jgi:2-polyprenyl-3-methyl-5-hydroxy-6-metoxy-1,4-benzoquinol methylase
MALREQGLWELYDHLGRIVPDLKKQYTSFDIDSEYLLLNVRGMHTFQIALVNEALQSIGGLDKPTVLIDIGDSAGTHIRYLQELHKDRELRCLSVNVDKEAVRRIRESGLEAVQSRAEDLHSLGVKAGIFISFEMLEHLPNPIQFLKNLSYHTSCQALIITVPYVLRSRIGLYQIRKNLRKAHNPENTHIFELCPDDWRLLFRHAGWAIKSERVYLQYPRHSVLRLMKVVWRKVDFEGFWGAVLTREHTWSDLYFDE